MKILVEAGATQQSVENGGCDVASHADSLKEAKERAKYYVSDEFAWAAELTIPLEYARVLVDEECVFDIGKTR